MNLQQLLNADIKLIGVWVRQGLSWWGRELLELIPPSLQARRAKTAPWLAQMSSDGSIRMWRDGVPAGPLDSVSSAVRPADLLVPEAAALVCELDLPRLSKADLRRMVELNLDRFTPFAADRVYFDTTILEKAAEGATQKVGLGVMLRDRGKAVLAQASAAGLKVERMGVGSGPDGRTLQFDFMDAIRAEEGGDPTRRRRAYLWMACAALVAVNVLAAVLRDMNDVSQLQGLVDAQRPTVALALKLRKTVETERGRRLALLTRRSTHEPLRILDAATRSLPAGQWVRRLEWNGRAARLVGFKKPGFDVLTALRSPALTNTRSLLSDMPTKAADGSEPFDVMADAATRPAR